MKVPELSRRMASYEKKLKQVMENLADQIVAGARTRVYQNLKNPKSNSALAESIRTKRQPDSVIHVFTDKSYARYVEFGTVTQPARPFLTPAVEEVKVTFSGLT